MASGSSGLSRRSTVSLTLDLLNEYRLNISRVSNSFGFWYFLPLFVINIPLRCLVCFLSLVTGTKPRKLVTPSRCCHHGKAKLNDESMENRDQLNSPGSKRAHSDIESDDSHIDLENYKDEEDEDYIPPKSVNVSQQSIDASGSSGDVTPENLETEVVGVSSRGRGELIALKELPTVSEEEKNASSQDIDSENIHNHT